VSEIGDIKDVVIVGSGPAGFAAAIYTARAQLSPVMLEGSVTAGGALMNTTEVENYPGFAQGIQGPELMSQMRNQAERFGTTIVTDDAVSLDLEGNVKVIKDSSGNEYRSRAVILAMGSGYRELGIPGEKKLSGHGVSWCATCDGFFFRGATIAVIGGGDSAMEEATFLTRFAEKVYVIHRRDSLRASKVMQERAFTDPKIEFLWNTETLEVVGDEKVTGLKIKNSKTGVEEILPVTGVFVAIGHDPRSELIRGQIDLDDNGYAVVKPGSTYTNLPGVFACGDLVDHVYRQAITAAGTGTMAALDCERWLAHQDQTNHGHRKEEVNV